MSDTRIESILRQEVGLDNRFLSGERLQRTVMQRMEVLGFSDRDAYFAKLRSSAEELDKRDCHPRDLFLSGTGPI